MGCGEVNTRERPRAPVSVGGLSRERWMMRCSKPAQAP